MAYFIQWDTKVFLLKEHFRKHLGEDTLANLKEDLATFAKNRQLIAGNSERLPSPVH